MQPLVALSAFFIHRIDPMLTEIAGIKIWYYGLIYSIGFLGLYCWFCFRRKSLNWSKEEVYDVSLLISSGVLVFAHAFEVIFYEWNYYRQNLWELLKFWHGGMATHGVLIGGAVGIWFFSRVRKRPFLEITDETVIPTAFFLGIGRIGNFINGENYGPITDVWWAVKFPYAEGFRHPVDLYDSAKNFLVVIILLILRNRAPVYNGKMLGHFLFLYGFLRLLVDIFREYESYFLGMGRGQYFNFLTALIGIVLIFFFRLKNQKEVSRAPLKSTPSTEVRIWKRIALVGILLFSMTIPSGWSQGWLKIHDVRTTEGLSHSPRK